MIKKCCNCNVEITFKEYYKHFLKNRYRYVCIKCGHIHKATYFSIILNSIIMFIPIVYLVIKNQYFINIVWILIYSFILQPFILQYKNN